MPSGTRYVSTTGALKHTACHVAASIERPHLAVRPLPPLAGAVEVPRAAHPHVRVQDDAVVPHDLEVLAVASTDSMVRPATGGIPISRGASKRTIFSSTNAVRSAAAARWMVSPSGTRATVGPGPRRLADRYPIVTSRAIHRIPTDGLDGEDMGVDRGVLRARHHRHGPAPVTDLARRGRRPSSGELADVGEGEADAGGRGRRSSAREPPRSTASAGVNQARSSASCVGWQSPSTGTT